jgi:hypothetical protein
MVTNFFSRNLQKYQTMLVFFLEFFLNNIFNASILSQLIDNEKELGLNP